MSERGGRTAQALAGAPRTLFRLWSAKIRVIFAGKSNDTAGPYGAQIPVPGDADDPLWTTWDPTTGLAEWVMYAVVQAIAEEYLTGGAERGARTPGDGVTWLALSE